MLAEYKNKGNLGIGLGIALAVGSGLAVGALATNGRIDPSMLMVVVVLRLAGLALFVWGCGMYAKAKGRSGVNCLWGFLGLIGLIVLACMKDHSLDPNNPLHGGGARGFDVQPSRPMPQGDGTPPPRY
jgi:hypothetical protein